MAFDWNEFLKLARYLAAKCQGDTGLDDEALQRCAVSRAYYAAFCHARNYARDNLRYVPTDDWDDHKQLRHHFKKWGKPSISTELEQLRQWRNDCDYKDTAPAEAVFRHAVSRAESLLGKLR